MARFEDAEAQIAQWAAMAEATPPADLNEATTRTRLIDTLFFDCLGWSRADCTTELRLDGHVTDYEFAAPHRALIVEAKREGIDFELPAGRSSMTRVRIDYFAKYEPNLFRAIKQCIDYCHERGTEAGAVSNGRQIAVFIASRSDGTRPLDGDVIAFDSPAAMTDNFAVLWKCLSKEGIATRGLARELVPPATAPPPDKLSRSISGYPGYKGRNPLQSELNILADLILEDVLKANDEASFLRRCYAESGALSQYALVSKTLLEARYSALFAKASAVDLLPASSKDGISPELLSNSLSRRPVLLIGDVGVGKTTFLRKLVRLDAAELLKQGIVLYIDLGSRPTLTSDLQTYVAQDIRRQLREDHGIDIEDGSFVRRLYEGELLRFGRGIHGPLKKTDPAAFAAEEIKRLSELLADREGHLRKSLEWAEKSSHRQVVVILDNVDQRSFEFQQDAFLVANGMADTWTASVFIAIRPDTFYKSKQKGALSAYQPRAFTIAPPRLDIVIEKRIQYAIELINGGTLASLEGVTLNLPTLSRYLAILLESFQGQRDLIAFCENMCGGNIREALDFIRAFLGSGHVDTQKILDIQARTGSYYVPLHEFLRAVIYGDYEHYDPSRSPIFNVFDVSQSDLREHFLVPLLLSRAERSGSRGVDGFVPLSDLYVAAQDLGFAPAQVESALARCVAHHLLERPSHSTDQVPDQDKVEAGYLRLTQVGAYYVKEMSRTLEYFDAMIVDTPILLPDFRERIVDVRSIGERLKRSGVMIDYLDACWNKLGAPEDAFNWSLARSRLRFRISEVGKRVARS